MQKRIQFGVVEGPAVAKGRKRKGRT